MNTQAPRKLPHDEEAERAVLAACLISGRALDAVGLIVQPDDFMLTKHRLIFETMLSMGAESAELDYLSLCDTMKRSGNLERCGGIGYLAELTTCVASAAQAAVHASIVKEHSVRRALIRLFTEQADGLYELGQPMKAAEIAQAEIYRIAYGRESRAWKTAGSVMLDAIDFCSRIQSDDNERLLGIPSGLIDLDALTGGFQRGALIIIGGRPSMGKTSLGLLAGLRAAQQGYKVGVLSMEMTARQLGLRLLSMDTSGGIRLNLSGLRRGYRLNGNDWRQVVQTSERLSVLSFSVDDSSSVSLQTLRAKARQLQMSDGLDVLIVDYLQLMEADNRNRREGLEDISRGLKILAKELDIAVVALSQLSRSVEQRDDKRPVLADLRETGAIEQDADVVIMIYRDDFYNPQSETPGVAELLARKNRDGDTGDVQVVWIKENATFDNLERYSAPEGGA